MFIWVVVFICCLGGNNFVRCDYSHSENSVQILLQIEKALLEEVQIIIGKNESLKTPWMLRKLTQIQECCSEAKKDSFAYVSNPINVYKLLRRFLIDWKEIEAYVKNNTSDSELDVDRIKRSVPGFQLDPTITDLDGMVYILTGLQKLYLVDIGDLVDGKMFGSSYSAPLTFEETYSIAQALFEFNSLGDALDWLLTILKRAKTQKSVDKDFMILTLKFIATCYYFLDIPEMALLTTDLIFDLDATSEHASSIREMYAESIADKKTLRNLFTETKGADSPSPVVPQKFALPENIMQLCRKSIKHSVTKKRDLLCAYTADGLPHRRISPFKVEELSLSPLVLQYHDILTDKFIHNIVEAAKLVTTAEKKGSLSQFTGRDEIIQLDSILKEITLENVETAASLEITKFGLIGQTITIVLEMINPEATSHTSTIFLYLNDVELGGATVFPAIELAVKPEKGSLLIWDTAIENESSAFDMKYHECPILVGSKWILAD